MLCCHAYSKVGKMDCRGQYEFKDARLAERKKEKKGSG